VIAALAAAEAKAKTLVVEKSPTIGLMREYLGVVGARCQKEAGCTIDPLAVTKELMRYASYRADQRLIKMWADESGETLDWVMGHLEPKGFSLVAETDVGDGYHDIYPVYPIQTFIQTPSMIASGMPKDHEENDSLEALAELAEEFGAEFRFNTALVQCIVEEGRVTGAVAKSKEGHIRINASKGVLLATGGYEGNHDLIAALQPMTYGSICLDNGYPQNIGEGIQAGIWAGGRKDASTAYMLFDRGCLPPDGLAGLPAPEGDMFWMGSQPWLKVDLEGERFCNEAAPYDFPIHAISLSKGGIWCPIWDANWQQNITEFHTLGCSRIDKSPTEGMTQSFLFPMIEGMNGGLMEKGYIQQADTVEELAEKLGLPPAALAATVDRYNKLAEAGQDSDFGKPAKDLIALKTPPFFGVRQGAQSLCSLDGLLINADCAVIDGQDKAIPGLWAAGNVSGGFFANNYPELLIGVASGRTMTQARHAVLNMLGK
ncbi:MAG: FAD-binding protein, partial [Coriobacteriaceae bacterium]|nr:FAD-binding protein [Coriobacteriaceae bacterium]